MIIRITAMYDKKLIWSRKYSLPEDILTLLGDLLAYVAHIDFGYTITVERVNREEDFDD